MLGLDALHKLHKKTSLIKYLVLLWFEIYTRSWINKIQLSKGVGSVVNGFSSITGQTS